MTDFEIAIVGGGPAGLTAGIYAARAGARTVILEKTGAGGQMLLTNKIHNYPGIAEITGAELAEQMRAQAEREGAEFAVAEVEKIERSITGDFQISTDAGELSAKAVIFATGTTPRQLGLPGEQELTGQGISYCVTCDAPLFANKIVAIYGGGNSALYSALELAKKSAQVHLIYRGENLRGDRVLQAKIAENPKIELILNAKITNLIQNEGHLTGLELSSREQILPVDGLFVAIGRIADSKVCPVQKTDDNYIITDAELRTSEPGIYAAGDIIKKPIDQIVSAAADGAIAATTACRDLALKR